MPHRNRYAFLVPFGCGHGQLGLLTGFGALCWLPDIRRWAATVGSLLRPDGFLFIRKGHPMLWTLGDSRPDGAVEIFHDYSE